MTYFSVAALFIMFRECLEAAIVVSMLLQIVMRMNMRSLRKWGESRVLPELAVGLPFGCFAAASAEAASSRRCRRSVVAIGRRRASSRSAAARVRSPGREGPRRLAAAQASARVSLSCAAPRSPRSPRSASRCARVLWRGLGTLVLGLADHSFRVWVAPALVDRAPAVLRCPGVRQSARACAGARRDDDACAH